MNPEGDPGLAARRAHFEYTTLGASQVFSRIPLRRFQDWITAEQGVRLPPDQRHDMTWMRVEAAMAAWSLAKSGRDTDGIVLSPPDLLGEAAERFNTLAENPATPTLIRAESYIGLGGMPHYRAATESGGGLNFGMTREKHYAAGKLLMRLAATRPSAEITRRIQMLSFVGLLRMGVKDLQVIGMPVPPRVRDVQDKHRFDMMLWDAMDTGAFWRAVVSATEQTSYSESAFISPKVLDEAGYPSPNGHGMLQAILENDEPSDPDIIKAGDIRIIKGASFPVISVARTPAERRELTRSVYLKKGIKRLGTHVKEQLSHTDVLQFETDPIEGLQEAHDWYASLPRMRRLTQHEAPALEQCINPFENAFIAGDLSLEHANMLGWLHAETGLVRPAEGSWDRSEDIFTATTQTAAEAGDWSAYAEALEGGATVGLYKKLAADEYNPQALALEYCAELAGAISSLHACYERLITDNSPHVPAVWRALQRLTACLVVSGGEDAKHLAVVAPPRQRAAALGELGFDISIMPQLDASATFSPEAVGRMQLVAGKHNHLTKLGVATVDPALVGQVVEGLERTPEGLTWDMPLAAYARRSMTRAIVPVLFL